MDSGSNCPAAPHAFCPCRTVSSSIGKWRWTWRWEQGCLGCTGLCGLRGAKLGAEEQIPSPELCFPFLDCLLACKAELRGLGSSCSLAKPHCRSSDCTVELQAVQTLASGPQLGVRPHNFQEPWHALHLCSGQKSLLALQCASESHQPINRTRGESQNKSALVITCVFAGCDSDFADQCRFLQPVSMSAAGLSRPETVP